jgi:hypothetical protein
MGIGGYALVIVGMEGFNFIFSVSRLYKKIPFKINLFKSLILPLLAALSSALLSKSLFVMSGREASALWLFLKIVFALCMFIAAYTVIKKFGNGKKPLPN